MKKADPEISKNIFGNKIPPKEISASLLSELDQLFDEHGDIIRKIKWTLGVGDKFSSGTSRLYRVYSIDGYNCLVVAENELEAKRKYNDKKSNVDFSQIIRIDLIAREYSLCDGVERLIM